MKIIKSIKEMMSYRSEVAGNIGFVPTMGSLHEGHARLVRQSVGNNEKTVVTVFVNPTQFNNPDDLENYPREIEKDIKLLESLGVDALYLPEYEEIYADNYNYKIIENNLANDLCGTTRPGHFEGVMTVLLKLFNIIRPTNAYFGEKDYQQYLIVKKMTEAFFMPINILPVPTMREADGLAMSSRNLRLSVEDRQVAPLFNKVMTWAESAEDAKAKLFEMGIKVDYLKDIGGRRYGAVFIGPVRLIDNVEL